jgi:hypothetical protein
MAINTKKPFQKFNLHFDSSLQRLTTSSLLLGEKVCFTLEALRRKKRKAQRQELEIESLPVKLKLA